MNYDDYDVSSRAEGHGSEDQEPDVQEKNFGFKDILQWIVWVLIVYALGVSLCLFALKKEIVKVVPDGCTCNPCVCESCDCGKCDCTVE